MTSMISRVWRDEGGLTLVELLVTMTLLALVMGTVTGTVVLLQRTVNITDQRFDDLGQARVAMDAATKSVRAAVRITPDGSPFLADSSDAATSDEIRFYANLDVVSTGAPRLVRLHRVGDELVEETTSGQIVVTGPEGDEVQEWQAAGSTRTRTLARGIPTAGPVFRFFDESGAELTDLPLSVADQGLVRQIQIDIQVQQSPQLDVDATQLRNLVRVPNLYYVEQEDE